MRQSHAQRARKPFWSPGAPPQVLAQRAFGSPKEKIEFTHKRFENLRQWYTRSYKNCAESIPVWIMAANLEENVMKDISKALPPTNACP